MVWSKRAVRRGVDALVPVVPTDPITRVWLVAENLRHYAASRSALGGLRLSDDAISG
jgi:hypothetical protein